MLMRIFDMKVCGLSKPMGFAVKPLSLSWKVDGTEGKRQANARVLVGTCPCLSDPEYDSGIREDIDSLCFVPDIALRPRTRYYWKVCVTADNGDTAEATDTFETGKMGEAWQAGWITSALRQNMCLGKTIVIDRPVKRARVYVTALGVYELNVNGVKAGDEVLTPYYNGYDSWQQITTFDIADSLREGENELTFMLGGGWAVARFGLGSNGKNGVKGLYADHEALLAEIRVEYEDGSEQVIGTDESWFATESKVRDTSIYDGETYDATYDTSARYPVLADDQADYSKLEDRLSPPLRVTERIRPVEIIKTPKNELVIDLGQEITGWIEFTCRAPKGTVVKLSYSEIMQQGCFYRDNLRSAKEEYIYISDGVERVVRPIHTFFGFRLFKVEGIPEDELKLEDFTGCVVHSDIPRIGFVQSDNPTVDRFFQNVLWGQRGNVLDTPTDCPQRDERLGWTGDAQAFSGTACFNMDCEAFFRKYLHDMLFEQNKKGGSCPHVVPACGMNVDAGSCAWGDAATVIPWNVYLFYGNRELLRETYPNMKGWVEWIKATEERTGGGRLWKVGFHFADWLALDTKNNSVMGATDAFFIASAYYYYSTTLLWKAAKVLGYAEDERKYAQLRDEIFDAIQNEYFTPNGLMAQTTQTAYVCALFMNFAPEKHRAKLAKLLSKEIRETNGQLRTGFVGTAYLNRVLSNNGMNWRAYRLFMNEDYPGWLYEVKMGATTVWERWNSVLPDGSISDTGMNSLNHYAYGAVMEWIYRDVAGLNPVEDAPGFRKAWIEPKPLYLLPSIRARYNSAAGWYESSWKIRKDLFVWDVEVPFGAEATLVFPFGDRDAIAKAHPELTVTGGDKVVAVAPAGKYHFEYKPTQRMHRFISVDMPVADLMEIPEVRQTLAEKFGERSPLFRADEETLRQVMEEIPFFGSTFSKETIEQVDEALQKLN